MERLVKILRAWVLTSWPYRDRCVLVCGGGENTKAAIRSGGVWVFDEGHWDRAKDIKFKVVYRKTFEFDSVCEDRWWHRWRYVLIAQIPERAEKIRYRIWYPKDDPEAWFTVEADRYMIEDFMTGYEPQVRCMQASD